MIAVSLSTKPLASRCAPARPMVTRWPALGEAGVAASGGSTGFCLPQLSKFNVSVPGPEMRPALSVTVSCTA